MKKFSLALVSVLLAATASHAADLTDYDASVPAPSADVFEPHQAAAYDWSGAYAGVNGGYSRADIKNSLTATVGEVSRTGSLDLNPNGFTGGAQAGYNLQFDNIIAGVETDIQGGSIKERTRLSDSVAVKNSLDWYGSTRARVGLSVTDNAMVYATGGAAYGKVKTTIEDGAASGFESKNKVGYAVGAGTEVGITEDISVKTEYLYTDLGKANLLNHTDDTGSVRGSTDLNFHTIRAGVNFRF